MTLSACTIANNVNATTNGAGGIVSGLGATTTLRSNIIAGNTGPTNNNCAGTFTDLGSNLEWTSSPPLPSECGLSTAQSDLFVDPLLSSAGLSSTNPLYTSEAGAIWTWAISPSSDGVSAYNNGSLAACNGTDQRGWQPSVGRVHTCSSAAGYCCSIGAYEPDSNGL